MTYRDQVAFGKNLSLQKQLKGKVHDYNKLFKTSRRHLDALEEECVASLYKLLLYGKEKQETTNKEKEIKSDKPEKVRPHSVFDLSSKEKEIINGPNRPFTSMSARTYEQSYSFKNDGMNIGKNRKDRFIMTRKEKKKVEEDVLIERRQGARPSISKEESIPADASTEYSDSKNETRSVISKSSPIATTKTLTVKRPSTGILIKQPQDEIRNDTLNNTNTVQNQQAIIAALDLQERIQRFTTPDSKKRIQIQENEQMFRSASAIPYQVNKTSLNRQQMKTPSFTVPEDAQTPGPVDHKHRPTSTVAYRIEETARTFSRNDGDFDDELISLPDDDKDHLEAIMVDNRPGNKVLRPGDKRYTSNSKLINGRNSVNELQAATENSQQFLTQYAKKSKIFGYVVKTRTSATATREFKKMYRSPYITYQELVSIKANIKQHESRTKELLQSSAKLSTYVDKLANAGNYRRNVQPAVT